MIISQGRFFFRFSWMRYVLWDRLIHYPNCCILRVKTMRNNSKTDKNKSGQYKVKSRHYKWILLITENLFLKNPANFSSTLVKLSSCLFSRAVFSISLLVCENSPLFPLLADRDVSPEGQKFHSDDVKSVRNLFRSSFRSYIVKLLFTNNRQKYKLSQRWNLNVMNLLQGNQFSSMSNVFWLLLQTHFGIAGARSPEGHKTLS